MCGEGSTRVAPRTLHMLGQCSMAELLAPALVRNLFDGKH